MRYRGFAALGLVLALGMAPARAAVLDYSSFHVLGDSLSDDGNVYDATFRQVPESPPYWRGRFSNGRVWAERVSAEFRDLGLPTSNEAWGGAHARTDRDGIPDLRLQASIYRRLDADRRGDRPLVAIWAGANDLLNRRSRTDARNAGRAAAAALGSAARSLSRGGVNDFLIFAMPDLGETPRFADTPSRGRAVSAGTRAYNAELDRQIADLRDNGALVRQVDTYALFRALIADSKEFGLRNVTTPCLGEDGSVCTPRQGRNRAFFDEIHPNRVVHQRLAEVALGVIEGGSEWEKNPAAAARLALSAPVPAPNSGTSVAELVGSGLAALGIGKAEAHGSKAGSCALR